jgi:ATP-dependent RNA helicase DeaD
LAQQTARQLSLLGKHMGVLVPAIYGGSHFREQIEALRTAPIVVATPGRLIDHLEQGFAALGGLRYLVLDEADEMISLGFKEALERLLSEIPRDKCRTWLFSATLPPHLQRVTQRFLQTPQTARLNSRQVLPGTVVQKYYTVREQNKPRGLCKLIDMHDDFYGLIFCQTKALTIDLTQYLRSRR